MLYLNDRCYGLQVHKAQTIWMGPAGETYHMVIDEGTGNVVKKMYLYDEADNVVRTIDAPWAWWLDLNSENLSGTPPPNRRRDNLAFTTGSYAKQAGHHEKEGAILERRNKA